MLAGAVGVVGLSLAALLAAAIVPGSHASGGREGQAVAAVAGRGASGTEPIRAAKVFDSNISARRYGTRAAQMENGVNGSGTLISDLSPVRGRRFYRPIAEYRRYAERWAARLGRALGPLIADLRDGDRAGARRDWTRAFSDYLHLGAVYGLLPGRLENRLAEVPPSSGDDHFPGLHRIEQGLWTGQSPPSLVPVATAVSRAVVTLRRVLPTVRVTAFDYILRAHEIMEDAQRDLMSGDDVPWSGEGVLGTAAALTAGREVMHTIAPILDGRENTLGVADYWLARLSRVFAQVRRPNGTYPTLGQLSRRRHELIDGTLAGTCTALSAVPDTLALHTIPAIPRIPGQR
jgi:hypothetical protein